MRIVVVCTGNVARSPALAWLLAVRSPRLDVWSAAVGKNAKPGLPIRRPMRELLKTDGYGGAEYAERHRSKLLADVPAPDMIVAVAPVHMRRLEELGWTANTMCIQCVPPIADPVWGGAGAYEKAWQQLQDAAGRLAEFLR